MMIDSMRRAARTWLGAVVLTVLLGFLFLGLLIFGISDIFRGSASTTVARVGGTEISIDRLRNEYQTATQRLPAQMRALIGPELVLNRLIAEAALDERANALGLSIPDRLIARLVMQTPEFTVNGQFNQELFIRSLRNSGYTEASFLAENRAALRRNQLTEALTGSIVVPLAQRQAFHRHSAERRTASLFTLGAAQAGDIPAPTEEQLRAFYEERRSQFRAPEYRSINILPLNALVLAKPDAVPEADVRRRYDEVKESRFGTPERRTIQQLAFATKEEAEAAAAKVKEGVTFEALAAERGVAPADYELGTFAKADVADPAVAEAAFALTEGGVSEPVVGRFGTVLVRVSKVEPAAVRPFEEVAAQIRSDIAVERARAEVDRLHDQIEDLRSSARPLTEIAKEKGLALTTVPAVDRGGHDKAGAPILTLPEREALLGAVFSTDVGVDTDALRTRLGGYLWYEVTGIEPARERTFDEVKGEVTSLWRQEEISKKLAQIARGLVERLDKGEPVEAVAGPLGVEVKTVADLARATPKEGLTATALASIFATSVGKAGSASLDPETRVVFKVIDATVPPFVTTTQEAAAVEERLRAQLTNDLNAELVAQIQKEVGVNIDQQMLRRVGSGES